MIVLTWLPIAGIRVKRIVPLLPAAFHSVRTAAGSQLFARRRPPGRHASTVVPARVGRVSGLTTGYSFYLKQFVLVDVIVLAQLYTVRVYGGGAATGVVPSHWLLTFSLFFFLSLALVNGLPSSGS